MIFSFALPDVDRLLYHGIYPRLWDRQRNPTEALGDYFQTYIERDLRQLTAIKDLNLFQRFMRLCAGRIGSLLNVSSLANDTGISHTTAGNWLSLLEASYIVFQLQPFHRNISKRLMKSPKLYFYDVGLAAFLLGIENEKQLSRDPLRGGLFENLVIAEALKYRFNQGKRSNLFFYRDSVGNEVDLLMVNGNDQTDWVPGGRAGWEGGAAFRRDATIYRGGTPLPRGRRRHAGTHRLKKGLQRSQTLSSSCG